MLSRIQRLRGEEQGVALVFALMVVFVVLLLAGVVFAQAVHNSTRSANGRKRVQSVDAAEAGLNYFYNYMENTPAGSLIQSPLTASVDVAPGTASFTVTPTWYDAAGNQIDGPFSDSHYPAAVHVVSRGSTNGTTPRTMESYMALHPVFGGFEGAIITSASTSFVNSFTINGSNGNDGDIVVTCPDPDSPCTVDITNGLQNIHGSLYVPNGSLNISSQSHVWGSAWANGTVTVDQPQAQIDHDAISSAGAVDVTQGTVGGQGTYCTAVSGTSNIAGGTVQKCQGPPPSLPFPHVTYSDQLPPAADPAWNAEGQSWYVVSFTDCSLARAYVQGTGVGTYNGGIGLDPGVTGVIVRITSNCQFSVSNNQTISLNSNLAIITNGSINLSQQTTWNGVGTTRNLFFIVPYQAITPPACNAPPSQYDISFGNKTNFNALVNVGVYTPGRANMNNLNAFNGQVVAGQTCIGNNWAMNYKPIVFPGQHVSGFTQDIAYIRERPNA
jgi:hypothetical protein